MDRKRTDVGADRGNQMGWDPTVYCRGTGGRTRGAFHLLWSYVKDISSVGVSVCVLVLMYCVLFGCGPRRVCILMFVYLCLWVSNSVYLSSGCVCVCVYKLICAA